MPKRPDNTTRNKSLGRTKSNNKIPEKDSFDDIESNFNNAIQEEIEQNIKDSFDQKGKRAAFVKNELNKIYKDRKWSVIYIYQGENIGYSYSFYGDYYFCFYRNYRILIESFEDTKNKNDISDLELRLEKSKKDNKELKEKIQNLQNMINEKEKEISELKEQNYEKNIKKLKEKIKSLENKIEEKEEEINDGRKEMLALQFKSTNCNIDYCIPCIKKDIFVDIEKKLYEKYKDYRETDNYFLFGGRTIFRFKTIEENKLESGSKIIFHCKNIEK